MKLNLNVSFFSFLHSSIKINQCRMESRKGNLGRLLTYNRPLPNIQSKLQLQDKEELRCTVQYRVVHNNRDSHPSKAKLWTNSAQTNPCYVSQQIAYRLHKSFKRILVFLLRWWSNLLVNCLLEKKFQLLPLQISQLCDVGNVAPTWTPLSSSLIMVHAGFATFADWIIKLMAITTHN